MSPVDVASIVPSTRTLLQVLATRRQRLAVVALIEDGADAGQQAARLDELSVLAFACAAPGEAMTAVAAATRSVPVLSLAAVDEPEGALAARLGGADGVCIARGLDDATWEAAASVARSTRMLALASVASRDDLDFAVGCGARAALVRASSLEEAIAFCDAAPRSVALLASVDGAGLDALRALVGHADAVLVGASLHRSADFAAFIAAVDP